MTPELIRQWLADGLIDLQKAAELLNQLYARADERHRLLTVTVLLLH